MPARRKPLPPELTMGAFGPSLAAAAGVEPSVLRGPGVRRIGQGLFLAASCDPTYQAFVAAYLRVLPAGGERRRRRERAATVGCRGRHRAAVPICDDCEATTRLALR